jgi:hypothetical protein
MRSKAGVNSLQDCVVNLASRGGEPVYRSGRFPFGFSWRMAVLLAKAPVCEAWIFL